MPVSRLRLRLAVWFAVAFFGGLVALDLSLSWYLWVDGDRQLTRQLRTAADDLAWFVQHEFEEHPDSGLAVAGREAIREWPAPPGAYLIETPEGTVLVASVPPGPLSLAAAQRPSETLVDLEVGTDSPIRRLAVDIAGPPPFRVVVLQSTERTEAEAEALAWWLTASTPVVLLLALIGGYVLSRRALSPVVQLADTIGTITPGQLDRRLPVHQPPDELDRVAEQFNGLLDRLQVANEQNRQFVRQAAHQIRTPLTLVVGETDLALREVSGSAAEPFRRIGAAAEQITRRVDELFLLAEWRASALPPMNDQVEADELILTCAETMRGRAKGQGRPLELEEVAATVFTGNRALLREALLELTENAIRHGVGGTVVLAARNTGGTIRLEVASDGPPIALPPMEDLGRTQGERRGLGLAIVQWIAGLHRGTLEVKSDQGRNRFAMVLPVGGGPSRDVTHGHEGG